MFFNPFPPAGIFSGNLWKPSLEILPLDAHQSFIVWIPKGARFSVIQDKSVLVCPTGRHKVQDPAINPAAVHSR